MTVGGVRHLVLIPMLLLVAMTASAESNDVPGSRDPAGLERFSRSTIVYHEDDSSVLPRELMTSRVDRVRRELRVEDVVRVQGTRQAVTYQIPDDASVADVVSHYRDALGSDVVFDCEGRACGRSADWAHQVFGQALLYGPDANQQYLAAEWRGRLVALYVNQRGNRRIYAHLEVLEPAGEEGIEPNALMVQRLLERGWTALDAVTPDASGALDADSARTLTELGGRLAGVPAQTIYVVCHLAGPGDADALIESSRRCAEEAAGHLAANGASAEGGRASEEERPSVRWFGAGPLGPRAGAPASRLELVIPHAPAEGR